MRANASKAISESFRFVAWAQSLRRMPTIVEIIEKWGCSRASAYRYRNALADAFGQYVERSAYGAAGKTHRTGSTNTTRVMSRESA